jgi:hypothetical protein
MSGVAVVFYSLPILAILITLAFRVSVLYTIEENNASRRRRYVPRHR